MKIIRTPNHGDFTKHVAEAVKAGEDPQIYTGPDAAGHYVAVIREEGDGLDTEPTFVGVAPEGAAEAEAEAEPEGEPEPVAPPASPPVAPAPTA